MGCLKDFVCLKSKDSNYLQVLLFILDVFPFKLDDYYLSIVADHFFHRVRHCVSQEIMSDFTFIYSRWF